MAEGPHYIFHVRTSTFAYSPKSSARKGNIVLGLYGPEDWPLWQIDTSEGWEGATIKNLGSGLFAVAEGKKVVTVKETEVSHKSLRWEIRQFLGVEPLRWSIQVPGKDFYWSSQTWGVGLEPANGIPPAFFFKEYKESDGSQAE